MLMHHTLNQRSSTGVHGAR